MTFPSLHLRRIVTSGATAAALLAAGGLVAPANAASVRSCAADSCSQSFSYTGALETFTVPDGVDALSFAVSGAQGGQSIHRIPGGKGATVRGVLPVIAGEQLTILIGQAGVTSGGETFGGGGSSIGEYLASGGGGSFIFDASGDPLVAAGGGGGSTVDFPDGGPQHGVGGAGAGAGGTGGSGTGLGYSYEILPTGGTPTSGGVHGSMSVDGNDGSGPATGGQPGRGGNGIGLPDDSPEYVGGGGGGGYYGGGGGAYGQAGAGGSGFADPSVTELTSADGDKSGNGVVSLHWAALPTTTAVSVHASSITAEVSAVDAGAGVPTGTVTFMVAGRRVGTANLVDGTAVLPFVVPSGKTRTVAAVYSGDDGSLASSSDSIQRFDPSITATVTSTRPTSKWSWYRTPITVRFHCAPNGAPLVAPCPAAVHFTKDGARQSVTRTIAAADGGAATVAVKNVNLDRVAPTVKVIGIKDGAVYRGKAPTAHCVAGDSLSGVASCKITRHASGPRTSYTATATDKAGNTTTVRGTYRVLTFYVKGASYRDGAFKVRAGHAYTLVVTDESLRPTYFTAVPNPHQPARRAMAFKAAGHKRWTLRVTVDRSMRSHRNWNLGVKVGTTMHLIKVDVAR